MRMRVGQKVVLVSDEDAALLKGVPVTVQKSGYVYCRAGDAQVSGGWMPLARFIMRRKLARAPAGYVVDHVNGNKLDNRRENLRVCSKSANALNASGSASRGVYRRGNRWHVIVRLGGKARWFGSLPTKQDALRVRARVVAAWLATHAE